LKDDTMSTLVEDREAIRQAARTFVRERAPVGHLRALRDARDPLGYSRELWREMAGLGFAGLTIPERFGGGGLGFTEQGAVLEELGRNLVPTPIVSAILGAGALAVGGADELQSILSRVCSGEHVVALAHEEGNRYAPYAI
jgi:alkylation response protein AidB-like acyl-CoA dehydrogenase